MSQTDVATRLLRFMMDSFQEGHISSIPIEKTFAPAKTAEAFQYMQQGDHIGKIVLELRHPTSEELQLGRIEAPRNQTRAALDSSASYMLVGGLGGLGRSVEVWMAQHGVRSLTFLSRGAGTKRSDELFVEEIQSMGCEVHLVRGDVTEAADVQRAVAASPRPLKGILQLTAVLRDQSWREMTIDQWHEASAPKVQGTWNLHRETQSLDLDFFVLFSSLSGIVGQPGQANYASANTFLDAFAKYRASQGLPCTTLDIGAVENTGLLAGDDELLKKMKGTGWRALQESELLGVLETVLQKSASPPGKSAAGPQDSAEKSNANFIGDHSTLVGIAPVVPLSSPDSSAKLRKDVRMSVFRNIRGQDKAGASSDGLKQFLSAAKTNPETLRTPDAIATLGQEIGKKLLSLVLRPAEDEIDVSISLSQLGLDSMVAVELRAWYKQMFRLDISILEMMSLGSLEAFGKRTAEGLAAQYG